MTDLVNQDIEKTEVPLDSDIQNIAPAMETDFSDTPAMIALEAKLLRRRKHDTRQTYRRPAYLQYIEYV